MSFVRESGLQRGGGGSWGFEVDSRLVWQPLDEDVFEAGGAETEEGVGGVGEGGRAVGVELDGK